MWGCLVFADAGIIFVFLPLEKIYKLKTQVFFPYYLGFVLVYFSNTPLDT